MVATRHHPVEVHYTGEFPIANSCPSRPGTAENKRIPLCGRILCFHDSNLSKDWSLRETQADSVGRFVRLDPDVLDQFLEDSNIPVSEWNG
jgi:hypothetical protein